jgi:hypothetical protein
MEAVEVARRVQNAALSAPAFCTPRCHLARRPAGRAALIEGSLALTRAAAFDTFLSITLFCLCNLVAQGNCRV